MSDLASIAIRARLALRDLADRAADQRGQTAAEYMGILLIVSLIIAALVTAEIHVLIKNGVTDLIKDIGVGSDSKVDQ